MFSSLFRRARRTAVATLAIAPFVIGGLSPAMATCTQPIGVYVGSGAGPASWASAGATQPSLSAGVANTTIYLNLPNKAGGNFRILSKFTTLTAPVQRIYQIGSGSAGLVPSPLDARDPPRQGLDQGRPTVDPLTCAVTLKLVGNQATSTVSPPGIREIVISPDSTLNLRYSMTVSEDGAVITLTDDDYKAPFDIGFPIELRRQ